MRGQVEVIRLMSWLIDREDGKSHNWNADHDSFGVAVGSWATPVYSSYHDMLFTQSLCPFGARANIIGINATSDYVNYAAFPMCDLTGTCSSSTTDLVPR